MSSARVVLVHGFNAEPASHWFPWLVETLGAEGVEVSVPALPTPDAPVPEEWIEAAVAAIGVPDERTVVIGHSIGCYTALRALDRIPGDWRLGGLVLVGGFARPLESTNPALIPFFGQTPDYRGIVERTGFRTVLYSDSDAIIPAELSIELADLLDASAEEVPGAGHFTSASGVTSSPQVAAAVRSALQA